MGQLVVSPHIDCAGTEMGSAWKRAFGKRSGLHHCGKPPKFTRYFG